MLKSFNKSNKYLKEKVHIEDNLKEVEKVLLDNQKAIIGLSLELSLLSNGNNGQKSRSELIQYCISITNNLNILADECSKYWDFMVNNDKVYFSELIKKCNTVSTDIQDTMTSFIEIANIINNI